MNLYRLLFRRNDLKSLIKGRPLQRIARKVIYKHKGMAVVFGFYALRQMLREERAK
jgi:hypothetical protein